MMTVFVLVVLWLIVVVPMVVRRNDERKRDRSVDGFGQAMRALGRRSHQNDAQVFVATARPVAPVPPEARLSTRRPVPAAQEALMYPVDRSEMSEARTQMMARRRRSLMILIAGTVVLLPLALYLGGITWLPGLGFAACLGGYFWFLRSQARKDRERRLHRQQRAAQRRTREVDATSDQTYFAAVPDSAVRIDDDDLAFQNMDTIDLTGLYSEDSDALAPAAGRRAS
jgi:membrane protein implicated in regulation of membrane protease activity